MHRARRHRRGVPGRRDVFVAITDTTTAWYRNYAAIVPKDRYAWSRRGLHIMMPGLTWTGSARQMQVKATTPWGSLTARFTPAGPVLNYSGNGLIGLLGDVNYDNASQSSWVTVLRHDGSYALAAVRPLAAGASEF